MKLRVLISALIIAIFPLSQANAQSAQSITLSLSDSFVSSSPAVARMKEMRVAFENGKVDACLKSAANAKKIAKSLEPWILALELECAAKLSAQKASSDVLERILTAADKKKELMAFGPWAPRLRTTWAKARLWAIEVDMKFNRTRAWSNVEKLSSALGSASGAGALLDEASRAKFWRFAGELLLLVQKNESAREFYRRSLAEQDQPDLRERLRTLDSQAAATLASELKANGIFNASLPPNPLATIKQAEGSPAEIELSDRISMALKSGDLVAAAEDSVKLMHDFPGSNRAKWAADRTQESLISVAEKSNEKFLPVREALLKAMEKGDSDRIAEWARVAFNRGLWAESARLGRAASVGQNASRSTKTLELAMDAAYAIDDFKTVKAIGEELVEKHSGTASARTAALRLGLLAFRLQDYQRATTIFEKLVATPSTDTLELQARYWLWRCLEKTKSERATAEGEEIARRYPFSYYGLRARLETSGGKIDWSKDGPKSDAKIENKIWTTQEEKIGFDRALVLLSAGWFDDAQVEIALLPTPVSPDAKAVRARLWGAAKNFLQASKLANDAWDPKFELRRPELMSIVWPSEYREIYEAISKAKGLDPILARSLTKQESGYNKRAVSTSNALGLMQMIPPTAREIADDLKLGKLNLPEDMFEPNRNIQMGTHYIAKMLGVFKGHVPLALAAYNAGPTRVDRWLKSRPSLKGMEATRSSSPDSELWIDEFPFNETSFYVKAILRNEMIYQMNESSTLVAKEPLW